MTETRYSLPDGTDLVIDRPARNLLDPEDLSFFACEEWRREGWISGCGEGLQALIRKGLVRDARTGMGSCRENLYEGFLVEYVTDERRKSELIHQANAMAERSLFSVTTSYTNANSSWYAINSNSFDYSWQNGS